MSSIQLQRLGAGDPLIQPQESREALSSNVTDTIKRVLSLRYEIAKTYLKTFSGITLLKMLNPFFLLYSVFPTLFRIGCTIAGVNKYALKIAQKMQDMDQIERLVANSHSIVSVKVIDFVLKGRDESKTMSILKHLIKGNSLHQKIAVATGSEEQSKCLESSCGVKKYREIQTTYYECKSLYRFARDNLRLTEHVLNLFNEAHAVDEKITRFKKVETEINSRGCDHDDDTWIVSSKTEYFRLQGERYIYTSDVLLK